MLQLLAAAATPFLLILFSKKLPDFFNEFTKVVQGWGNPLSHPPIKTKKKSLFHTTFNVKEVFRCAGKWKGIPYCKEIYLLSKIKMKNLDATDQSQKRFQWNVDLEESFTAIDT